MLLKLFLVISMVLAFQANLFAYDYDRALNNLSDEFVQCAAFFSVATAATKATPKENSSIQKETLEKLSNSYESLINLALLASSQDVVLARYKLTLEDMLKKIKYDYSNISILLVDYINICPEARDKPFQRLKYWLDKK